jgi:DNA polymerase III alpha subunit
MEKSINNTLHSIVDYATDKFVSGYCSAKKGAEKMTSKFMSRNSNSHVVLYSGIALATAGAVYLLVKNREAVIAAVKDFMQEQTNRFTAPQQA